MKRTENMALETNIYSVVLWINIIRGYSRFSLFVFVYYTRNSDFYKNRLKCIGTLPNQFHNIQDVALQEM